MEKDANKEPRKGGSAEDLAALFSVAQPGMGLSIEDYVTGNWRGSELINCIDSYALEIGSSNPNLTAQTTIRALDRIPLDREELLRLQTIAQDAYRALTVGQGPYARVKGFRDSNLAEQYSLIERYAHEKLK